MTLHSAITDVLSAAGRPLPTREIADEVNRRDLYKRSDGKPLPSSQIGARVRNYPGLFVTTPWGVWIAKREIPAAPESTPPLAAADSGDPSPAAESLIRPLQEIEIALLDPMRFQSARIVDTQVPPEYGLYAIRVRDVAKVPESYRSVAEARKSNLLYLGEATKRTLQHRFLGNELRGRGHGTFFRSLGAVLGYRPPAGSLDGRANQRNYRFSSSDNAAIVKWINANLEVSWVAFNENVHANEVALIQRHTPLLNLRDNPRALPELLALRTLCCKIASQRIRPEQVSMTSATPSRPRMLRTTV